jgi:hypothetical protein
MNRLTTFAVLIAWPAAAADPEHDLLSALDLWVEKSIAPIILLARGSRFPIPERF